MHQLVSHHVPVSLFNVEINEFSTALVQQGASGVGQLLS